MRKRRERACFISEHLCFPRFENINVLEALAKQRCVSIGKQNVYQWSASFLERRRPGAERLVRLLPVQRVAPSSADLVRDRETMRDDLPSVDVLLRPGNV